MGLKFATLQYNENTIFEKPVFSTYMNNINNTKQTLSQRRDIEITFSTQYT